jgi:MerR family transcriptional regulator/heat shock protein HspR
MHPQTLRKYERVGLIFPTRSGGMLRLYSDEDIARLRLIKYLVDDLGLNLAGVELVMELINRLLRLRLDLSRVPYPGGLTGLVTDRLDAIFEMVNLSFPGERGR